MLIYKRKNKSSSYDSAMPRYFLIFYTQLLIINYLFIFKKTLFTALYFIQTENSQLKNQIKKSIKQNLCNHKELLYPPHITNWVRRERMVQEQESSLQNQGQTPRLLYVDISCLL